MRVINSNLECLIKNQLQLVLNSNESDLGKYCLANRALFHFKATGAIYNYRIMTVNDSCVEVEIVEDFAALPERIGVSND